MSGIPVDDVKLMGYIARGGSYLFLEGANVGGMRDTVLESDDESVGNGICSPGNGKKGGRYGNDGEEEGRKNKEFFGEHGKRSCSQKRR